MIWIWPACWFNKIQTNYSSHSQGRHLLMFGKDDFVLKSNVCYLIEIIKRRQSMALDCFRFPIGSIELVLARHSKKQFSANLCHVLYKKDTRGHFQPDFFNFQFLHEIIFLKMHDNVMAGRPWDAHFTKGRSMFPVPSPTKICLFLCFYPQSAHLRR